MKKSRFLTCSCHKICRVEAVDLLISNFTLKITIFMHMWHLGPLVKNLYFALIKVRMWEFFCTYNCDYLLHMNHISFLLNQFSVKYRFPFPILRVFFLSFFFYRKIIALLKDPFLKKMLIKRNWTRRLFLTKL